MQEYLFKLRNVLKQEHSRRYDNVAVIGGLTTFINNWAQQALAEGCDAKLIQHITALLADYGEQPPEERHQAVKQVMAAVQSFSSTSQRDSHPPTQKSEVANAKPMPAKSHPKLDSPVDVISGISDTRSRQLARLNVFTVRDLLFLFPRRYDDFSALKPINKIRFGDEVSLIATVFNVSTRRSRTGTTITTAILSDATGTIRASWFNRRGLEQRLKSGREIIVSGKVGQYLGYLTFESPEWEALTSEHLNTARLVPVYPLTEGLHQRWMRRIIKRTLDAFLGGLKDPLPSELRETLAFPELRWAVGNMHFPESWEVLDRARKRLAFDEFFMLQLGMLQRKRIAQMASSTPLTVQTGWLDEFEAGLPFKLTGAQRQSLQEILGDLAKPHPMSRLLQGDVGSGKTVVALGAMLAAVGNGKQAALMAPTEILAEQHYRTIDRLLGQAQGNPFANARLAILVGDMPQVRKSEVQEQIATGKANIVVGTHALIQGNVVFQNLGIVVVDEQHRFGVQQRAELAEKGQHPHTLVMSATPIPRSLALTLYGDLELSIIDEMPPGRQTIYTRWAGEKERERIYAFIRAEIEKGGQAFIICPMIEGSDNNDIKAATEEYERLQSIIFPSLRVGLLHGKMSGTEKDEVMQRFASGEIDILVSTSVVEVGIDVPQATVMMVEEAHRFGLSQLHQFRGRVGRGTRRSYCILMSDQEGDIGERRLKAIERETDGFKLAEIDLQLRGPGEFFGTRQSGMPDLRVARLSDLRTLEQARKTAEYVLESDPRLEQTENDSLKESLQRFWGDGLPTA